MFVTCQSRRCEQKQKQRHQHWKNDFQIEARKTHATPRIRQINNEHKTPRNEVTGHTAKPCEQQCLSRSKP